MLDDRLTAGRGFAAFGRTAHTAGAVARYLHLDRAIRHVVLTYHPTTDPDLLARVGAACAEVGASFRPVAWADYGEPGNVAHVASLPPAELAFVSADHHLTVHDRLDVRRGYVRRKAAGKKVALDTIPYEVLPWRVFFPFAFFDRDLLGYHHSYALEQDHEKFLDGHAEEDPCAAARLAPMTWRAAIVEDWMPIAPPARTEVTASAAHHAEYERVRDDLFASEKSIASVKAKLSRWIQERYPAREVPVDLKRVYAADFDHVVVTDLPFDRWLASEIDALVAHTRGLIRRWVDLAREGGG